MVKLLSIILSAILLAISSSAIILTTKASPPITAFFNDLAGFNVAAGSPPIVVDFDDVTPNTNITDLTIHGVTFHLGNQPAPSAALIVVKGSDTYSSPGFDWYGPDNRLFATSGENILSPGGVELAPGPDPLKENDDLAMTLSTPVSAIGFDILYQLLDGYSYTSITLLDATDNVLYSNSYIPIPESGNASGGTTFVGFVSDSPNIAKIIIDDYDEDNLNPDSNIGFDTIRLPVIYIRADGSIDPQTAPIQWVGDIYTFTDNINGSIVIEKDNIMVDGACYILQGTGYGKGIDLSGRSNVTIKKIKIQSFWYGIGLESSSNNAISGNKITNNSYGIYLWSSSSNSIFGNNITNNGNGISLDYCNNNTIIENNITNNKWIGISLYYSFPNTIIENNITENYHGISLGYSGYNRIVGNNITNNRDGISVDFSYYTTISGNNITNNSEYGISLSYSSNNTISGNIFVNDGLLIGVSYGNVVVDNLVNAKPLVYLEGVLDRVVGEAGQVILIKCNNITVQNLNLSNTAVGIELWETNSTEMRKNNITNNSEYGIWLIYSSNNTISGNNITNNSVCGIQLEFSSNNKFNHNNFINNLNQALSYYSGVNTWDDGYPSGGNYWSDYMGIDSNGDGMGDSPYIIDSNNQDNYPLMNPHYIWTPDTASPSITILSPQNTTYTTSSIPLTFTVNEPTSWIGYSLDGQANVTISGNTTLTSLSDGQHSITVYANDTSGNMGASNKVFLTVQTPPPTPIAPIRETPPPENAAVAVATGAAITVGVTGLMSISGLGQSLNAAIAKMNIPDWLKDFLQLYSEEVFKTLTKEKIKARKKVPLFTKKEIATIIFSASIITIVFGYVEANGLPQFSSLSVLAVVIPPVLSTVAVISVTNALFTALSSKIYNVKSESKVWLYGVIAFLVSGLLFLVPFAGPSRSTYQCGEISKKTKGLLVLSKTLLFLTLSIPFSLLFIFGFMSLGDTGLLIILTTVSYSLIPIKPLEGKEIFDFDKKVWLATFAPLFLLFLGWVLHLLPHIVYLGVGLSSAFIWVVTFRQATSKKRNE